MICEKCIRFENTNAVFLYLSHGLDKRFTKKGMIPCAQIALFDSTQ